MLRLVGEFGELQFDFEKPFAERGFRAVDTHVEDRRYAENQEEYTSRQHQPYARGRISRLISKKKHDDQKQ